MNAVKLLGSLLGNNATGGSVSEQVLASILSGGGGSSSGSNRGMADPLGALLGGSGGEGGGALGAILGAAMGGRQARGSSGGSSDLAGKVLGTILSGGQGQAQNSGAAGLLGGILGGGEQQSRGGGGGLSGLLGGLLGGSKQQPQQAPQTGGGGLGGLLGGILGGQQPDHDARAELGRQAGNILDNPPAPAQDEASILIKAMLNAAKSDGKFDQNEQQKVLGKLGDVEQSEIDFIQSELSRPLDLQGFVNEVPRGLEQQVYAFSVMGIKLDTQGEANYLGQLAQGLRLQGDECNAIHQKLGAPPIFR